MRADKPTDKVSSMPNRQKIVLGVFIIIVLFILWQFYGIFFSNKTSNAKIITPENHGNMAANQPPMPTPKPALLTSEASKNNPEVQQRIKAQQELETKYLSALNELQMLKVSREIAETSQAIASARLATVTSEKNIVDLLKPPAPPPSNYSQALGGNGQPQPVPVPPQKIQEETSYNVISVTNLRNKWNAVIAYQQSLYQVSIGDVLPPDKSTVVVIDNSGVVLEKDGAKRRISMVPIIQ